MGDLSQLLACQLPPPHQFRPPFEEAFMFAHPADFALPLFARVLDNFPSNYSRPSLIVVRRGPGAQSEWASTKINEEREAQLSLFECSYDGFLLDASVLHSASSPSDLLEYMALLGEISDSDERLGKRLFDSANVNKIQDITNIQFRDHPLPGQLVTLLASLINTLTQPSAPVRAASADSHRPPQGSLFNKENKEKQKEPAEDDDSDSDSADESGDSFPSLAPLVRAIHLPTNNYTRSRSITGTGSSLAAFRQAATAAAANTQYDAPAVAPSPSLVDGSYLAFPVSKLSRGASASSRVLRLSDRDLSVLDGPRVTACHDYGDVFCVTPLDAESFSISFVNDVDLVYASAHTAAILSAISERLANRKTQEKKDIAAIISSPDNVESIQSNMHRQSVQQDDAPQPLAGRRVNKVEQLTGSSESQLVESSIAKLIFDSNTEEGRARLKFLKSLPLIKKNPNNALPAVRQFMDSLSSFIHRKRLDGLRKLAPRLSEDELGGLIERGIESAIVAPWYERLCELLRRPDDAAEPTMRTMGQSAFGIPEESQSPNEWADAVRHLSLADKKFLPWDKLDCVLNSCRAVYADHLARRAKPNTLSADDFFPIFVFVLSRSTIAYPDAMRQFCWGLCSRDRLNGEGGYYLTVFEAAIEYLKSEKKKLAEKLKQ